MADRKRVFGIMCTVALCCLVMAFIDGVVKPHYAVKSAVKLVLFSAVPVIYCYLNKEVGIWQVLKTNKRGIGFALLLCLPVFGIILGAYAALKDIFDFSAVTTVLTGDIGVNKGNFVFVATYIAFVNSFLEEFFFRGFAFLALKKMASAKVAYIFSGAAFALYHIAIMSGWFSVWVFLIIIAGLFAGGLIFNCLDARGESIYTSWLVHMFANFAINLIGFSLFGII